MESREESPGHLKRVLGPWALTSLGIGSIIGAGIFALTGLAASKAGPGIMLSFVIAAMACAFAGFCYAEFASMIPVAGSAYTYAYATLGEMMAWLVGWNLLLEYAVGNSAVASSWGGYFNNLLAFFNFQIPPQFLGAPNGHGNIINLPALLIVLIITWLLARGIQESSKANNVMVIVKLAIILFFIGLGGMFVKPMNWQPFMPHGFSGVMAGAGLVFFAFIGFDAVSTTAEECKDPGRNLPRGILFSLGICTLIYAAVALVVTGMLKYTELGKQADPLAYIFTQHGLNGWAGVISFGAIIATTAALLVYQVGQPRIFMSMSRDGLLSPWFGKVSKKHGTPGNATFLTGCIVAIPAALLNISEVVELTNIGTLFAFSLVCCGVMILRARRPEATRRFRMPWVWVTAPLGILFCIWLAKGLPAITWYRFFAWLLLGLLVYFVYGFRNSALHDKREKA
ncbi:MAG TPA: amino acid permease [Cyanobacteria bacterium UBA8530]|nr:amino acid permease [Cyanobacteria bacterium UBA8530]